jgi:hypothetical protein
VEGIHRALHCASIFHQLCIKEFKMVFQKGVIAKLIERTRQHFAQAQTSPSHEEYRGNERREDVRPYADSRLYRARFGFPGSYRVYTKDGCKAIFNVWVSEDGMVRLLHPKVCWRGNVEIVRFEDQGPYLPIKVLSGIAVDTERFPEKHRETLAQFQLILLAAVEAYDEQLLQHKEQHKEKDAVPPASS